MRKIPAELWEKQEERRGADFADRSRESATAAGNGFVQVYTAELAVSAIISSWHRGNEPTTSGWFLTAEKIAAETLLGN